MNMHVAQISFYMDPERRTPARLLQDWPSLVDVAEAASRGGVDVTVIQACSFYDAITRNDVGYRFLPFDRGEFGELVRSLSPDVCHVHGLGFPRDVLSLSALLPQTPIVLQDHASGPPRPWRRRLWGRAFAAASGIAFCALEQVRPFAKAGLIPAHLQLFEIPESTSRFAPADQASARAATGVTGDPIVLWVGHLDANKDPLTVLEGFSLATKSLPRAQLWCCFGTAPLLGEVERRLANDAALRERVHLIGRVPHERIEQLMQAADLFVLGSHREGSGYALIEALACGLPPVVTDIPSFRALTASGNVGALWPCGNPQRLAEAMISIARRPKAETRAAVREHFEREQSFDALGGKLRLMYEHLVRRAAAGEPCPA